MADRRIRPRWEMLASVLLGCVIVSTGEHAFSESFDLEDVASVRLSLPSTPLSIEGCNPEACEDELTIEGRWLAVGVTEGRAEELARDGGFDFDVEDGFGRLVAVRPIDVEDLLDLEVDAIEMPWDRDLEVRTGVGDVAVDGWVGNVDVRIDAGDVNVTAAEGVSVRSGHGRIRVETGGVADLATNAGSVVLVQTDLARNAYIFTGFGDVFVELASDEDLSLEVRADGRIEVDTERIRTITTGSFSRTTGNGSRQVQITADFGAVEVVLTARREAR